MRQGKARQGKARQGKGVEFIGKSRNGRMGMVLEGFVEAEECSSGSAFPYCGV